MPRNPARRTRPLRSRRDPSWYALRYVGPPCGSVRAVTRTTRGHLRGRRRRSSSQAARWLCMRVRARRRWTSDREGGDPERLDPARVPVAPAALPPVAPTDDLPARRARPPRVDGYLDDHAHLVRLEVDLDVLDGTVAGDAGESGVPVAVAHPPEPPTIHPRLPPPRLTLFPSGTLASGTRSALESAVLTTHTTSRSPGPPEGVQLTRPSTRARSLGMEGTQSGTTNFNATFEGRFGDSNWERKN
jgi:hypothetical protein